MALYCFDIVVEVTVYRIYKAPAFKDGYLASILSVGQIIMDLCLKQSSLVLHLFEFFIFQRIVINICGHIRQNSSVGSIL